MTRVSQKVISTKTVERSWMQNKLAVEPHTNETRYTEIQYNNQFLQSLYKDLSLLSIVH